MKNKITFIIPFIIYGILIAIVAYLSYMFFIPIFNTPTVEDPVAQLPRTTIEQPKEKNDDNIKLSSSSSSTTVNDSRYLYAKTGYKMMGIEQAWSKVKSNHEVTVAVLDSGCNYNLKDLKGNINTKYAYDAYSQCELKDSEKVKNGDNNGHGTYVCSVISSIANNKWGTAGVSYNATVLPIKVGDNTKDANAPMSSIIRGYEYLFKLLDQGKIENLAAVNISYGTTYNTPKLEAAIKKMRDEYGIITVAAAGNDGNPWQPTEAEYPSDYDSVLSVEAVDEDKMYAWFTSWNENKDVAAYGDYVPVVNLKNKNDCELVSGTSFSSPCVAGIVALLKSYDTTLTPDEIENLLKTTTTKALTGVDNNEHRGGVDGSTGIVNAKKALNALIQQRDDFTQGDFKGLSSKYAYTGKPIKPAISVYIGNKKIDKKYYNVSYKNNKEIGTAIVTATGKDKYKGKKFSETFQIVPAYTGKIKFVQSKNAKTAHTITLPKYKGQGKVIKYYHNIFSGGVESTSSSTSYDWDWDKSRKIKIKMPKGKYTIKAKAKVQVGKKICTTKYISKEITIKF